MKRGYLGPLGDDFPAIFPVAFGLMLFFAAITLTFNLYNYKQDTVALMRSNIALSKAVRSQLIFDEELFFGERGRDGACDLFDRAKVNYGVQAKMELKVFTFNRDKITERVDRLGSKLAECGDLEDDSGVDLPYDGDFSVAMVYPVAVHVGDGDRKETQMRSLVITTWL